MSTSDTCVDGIDPVVVDDVEVGREGLAAAIAAVNFENSRGSILDIKGKACDSARNPSRTAPF